jgi:hypothetical protein
MRSGLTYLIRVLGICAAAAALAAAPVASADPQPPPPAPPTVTVTVMAPAPGPQDKGPQDNQACTSSVSSIKCVKPGDAEINAGIPAPYPGPFGVYGPYWAG